MTCKDCVHYEVCFKTSADNMEHCEHFQDKSKFIELTCKIGETVCIIINKNGIKSQGKEVIKFEINNMRFKQDGKTIVYSCLGRYEKGHYYFRNFVFNSIGKTVFLTKEEAERALKEV